MAESQNLVQERGGAAGGEAPDEVARLIGRALRAARLARCPDPARPAACLGVEAEDLLALEEGRFDWRAVRPFRLALLRAYADHIGIDGQALTAGLRVATPSSAAAPGPRLWPGLGPGPRRRLALATAASLAAAAGMLLVSAALITVAPRDPLAEGGAGGLEAAAAVDGEASGGGPGLGRDRPAVPEPEPEPEPHEVAEPTPASVVAALSGMEEPELAPAGPAEGGETELTDPPPPVLVRDPGEDPAPAVGPAVRGAAAEPGPEDGGPAALAAATGPPDGDAGAGRGFAVQVGSLRDPAGAAHLWRRLAARHPGSLGGLEPLPPLRAEVAGRGTFHRVLGGPFATRAEARAACGRLRAGGVDCGVVALP